MNNTGEKQNRWIKDYALGILACVIFLPTLNGQLPPVIQDATAFSSPENVSNNAGASRAQQIAIGADSSIYFVWLDNTPGYNAVFFSRSVDGGLSFSGPQNLSSDPAGSSSPRIAVDSSGNINVVWETPYSFNGTAFFSRSSDGGETFSSPRAIANGVSDSPTIALDSGGNIYVIWFDYLSRNILLTRSNDGGTTFSPSVQVTNREPKGNMGYVLMTVDSSGDINILWEDFVIAWQIWFSRSNDCGNTFAAAVPISSSLEFESRLGMAVDSAGNINAVWNTQSRGDVYLSRSVDGGLTFRRMSITHNNAPPFLNPCCAKVAVDWAGGIDIVWSDVQSTSIVFNRSGDGGATFSTTKVLNAADPDIGVDSRGAINLVWDFGNQIQFSRSSDFGTTFSSSQTVSSSGGAAAPLLAIDPQDNIGVAWTESAPGNQEIFFRRGLVVTHALPLGVP